MTAVDTKPTTSGKSRRRTIVRVLGATALALGVTAAGGYLWLNQTSEVRNTGVAECTTVTPNGGSDADLRGGVCDLGRDDRGMGSQ